MQRDEQPPSVPPVWSLPEAVPNLALVPRQRDGWIVAARIATVVAVGFGLSLIALLGTAARDAAPAPVTVEPTPAAPPTPGPHCVLGRIGDAMHVIEPALAAIARRPLSP